MGLFGGKKKGGGNIPADRVMSLSSQGIPETEIIRTLKNEGYSPTEVDSAMKAALRGSVAGPPSRSPPAASRGPPPGMGAPPPPGPGEMSPEAPPRGVENLGMPPLPGDRGFGEDKPPSPAAGSDFIPSTLPPEGPVMPPSSPLGPEPGGLPEPPSSILDSPLQGIPERHTRQESQDHRRQIMEETVEGIIEEKWDRMMGDIDDMRKGFSEMQNKIAVLEQSIKSVHDEKKSEFGSIEDKIDTYKQSINEIAARMGAVEGAMQNSLTPMMQTLRELNDSVNEIKESKEK